MHACVLLGALLGLLLATSGAGLARPARAAPPAPAPEPIPAELKAWIPWVQAGDPSRGCARVVGAADQEPRCAWQGVLTLDVDDAGADFTLQAVLDRAGTLELPGGPGAWPAGVVEGKDPVAVLARGDAPTVSLKAGFHALKGRIRWTVRPQTLRLPAALAVLRLSEDGVKVLHPAVNADGALRLGGSGGAGADDATLTLDVSRRIVDDVPVMVVTHIAIRASGAPREVDLGAVLLEGSTPVQIDADVPARIDPDGHLRVQLRPGSFSVEIRAVHSGPVRSLTAPLPPAPGWPAREFWVLEPDDGIRAVEVSGAPGIDPQRASLPAGWEGFATWMLEPGMTLTFTELRRGQGALPPNQLHLQRRLWLDPDGDGWTVEDRILGTMRSGWRLSAAAPLEVGAVVVGGKPEMVTLGGDGAAGVELRGAAVDVRAESRISTGARSIPAVGWQTEANAMSIDLMLPPGWRLFAATGADRVVGDWWWRTSALDALLVGLAVVAVARLAGWRWAAVAVAACVGIEVAGIIPLVVLGFGAWSWLARRAPPLIPTVILREARLAAGCVAWLLTLVLVVNDVKTAALPSTEARWGGVAQFAGAMEPPSVVDAFDSSSVMQKEANVDLASAVSGSVYRQTKAVRKSEYDNVTLQVDPGAVIQTGPGLPQWGAASGGATLSFDGTVSPSAELRLILLSPVVVLLWTLAQGLALLALLWRLALRDPRAGSDARPPAAIAAALLVIAAPTLAPAVAQAAPDPTLLSALAERVSPSPECRPNCAEISALDVNVKGGAEPVLSLRLEVHAGEASSVPLPGPAATWAPEQVLVDGDGSAALTRAPDGFIHVRVPAGVHVVEARGPIRPDRGLTLQVGLPPRVATMAGAGWSLLGVRPDGSPERSVQLVPTEGAGADARSSDNLAPWILVRRFLDLGMPWRVRTSVRRIGPSLAPLSLRVPLVPGEAVMVDGLQVVDGAVVVSLDQSVSSVEWTGTLAPAEALELTAPVGVPWTEEWALSCSPIFRCVVDPTVSDAVPAPFSHEFEGAWRPQWRPWPGERLRLQVERPSPAPGATLTITSAELEVGWAERGANHTLNLAITASQGGQHRVRLPPDAAVDSVQINGVQTSSAAAEGVITLPLKPGQQVAQIKWRGGSGAGWLLTGPALDLGAPVSNLRVTHRGLGGRWLLALTGGGWGPHALLLPSLLFWLAAASGLRQVMQARRWWGLPLGWVGLSVLIAGLVSFGVVELALLALATLAAQRASLAGPRPRLALPLLTLFSIPAGPLLALMCAVVGAVGLTDDPRSLVAGVQSTGGDLTWVGYRTPGTLMPTRVLSAPAWVWHAAVITWSLALLRGAPALGRAWLDGVRRGLSAAQPARPDGAGSGGGGPGAGAPRTPGPGPSPQRGAAVSAAPERAAGHPAPTTAPDPGAAALGPTPGVEVDGADPLPPPEHALWAPAVPVGLGEAPAPERVVAPTGRHAASLPGGAGAVDDEPPTASPAPELPPADGLLRPDPQLSAEVGPPPPPVPATPLVAPISAPVLPTAATTDLLDEEDAWPPLPEQPSFVHGVASVDPRAPLLATAAPAPAPAAQPGDADPDADPEPDPDAEIGVLLGSVVDPEDPPSRA